MNYLQCQKIERNKCESNMIFLGFVFYREIKGGYNPGYSWWGIHYIHFCSNLINIINSSTLDYFYYKYIYKARKKSSLEENFQFIEKV